MVALQLLECFYNVITQSAEPRGRAGFLGLKVFGHSGA
jgi:hypothetical protein